MLKRDIKYTYQNDAGEDVTETETHYFNLSKREILKLEVDENGGLSRMLKEVSAEDVDNKEVFDFFERFVLMSYGIRGNDGKSFDKSEEIKETFTKSLAYDALFDQLAFSDNSARYLADFIKGVMPPDMISGDAIEKAVAEMKAAQDKAELEAAKPAT